MTTSLPQWTSKALNVQAETQHVLYLSTTGSGPGMEGNPPRLSTQGNPFLATKTKTIVWEKVAQGQVAS